MAGVLKKTTGLTGLAVSKKPRLELQILYDKILRYLTHLPQDYTYRKSVENLIKQRNDIIQQTEDISVIEEKIGQGQVEELVVHAKHELSLVQLMIKNRPWENLMQTAPPNQWVWPPHK